MRRRERRKGGVVHGRCVNVHFSLLFLDFGKPTNKMAPALRCY